MKRNYRTDICSTIDDQDLLRQIAFHEAGHAAAIYLYNKQQQLPPVYFRISIQALSNLRRNLTEACPSTDYYAAVVEGGRLIHCLPLAMIERAHLVSDADQSTYRAAFEADMVNLLIGPLAEAKHVALRDDEPFNARLVNLAALQHYGGASDLEKVHEYLDIFLTSDHQREEKLAELFVKAYEFISSTAHWRAIGRLADFIVNNMDNVISCEQAIAVLELKA
ncbi:MAG: hypothetical protein ACXWF8_04725 [Methylobacter sp.]